MKADAPEEPANPASLDAPTAEISEEVEETSQGHAAGAARRYVLFLTCDTTLMTAMKGSATTVPLFSRIS